MLQGDAVSRRQWEGFAISTVGFLLYTWAKNGGGSTASVGHSRMLKKKRN